MMSFSCTFNKLALMGLGIYPSKPLSITLYSSEAKAKAVMAMIGTLAEYLRIVLLE